MAHFRAIGFDVGETLITYAAAPLNWVSLYRPALEQVARRIEAAPSAEQYGAAEEILKRYNTRLYPRTAEVPAEKIFEELLRAWSRRGDAVENAVHAFFSFFQQSLCCYDDTLPALQQLRASGILVGALTDVPYGMPRTFVERDLTNTGVAPLLDHWLTSVDVGTRKPAPDGFHRLAEKLRVRPDEMLYVGNEPKDIDGAKAAGLTAVLIRRDGAIPAYGQDVTVGRLTELGIFLK